MREIKFRGKAITGVWVYGGISIKSHGTFINDENLPYDDCCAVIPETIGQFTGVKDKNGVEIYEGDICEVRIMPCSPDEEEYIARITFEDGCFKFDDGENHLPHLSSLTYEPYTNGYHPCVCEVIGNIHEHPRLLKGESEA